MTQNDESKKSGSLRTNCKMERKNSYPSTSHFWLDWTLNAKLAMARNLLRTQLKVLARFLEPEFSVICDSSFFSLAGPNAGEQW